VARGLSKLEKQFFNIAKGHYHFFTGGKTKQPTFVREKPIYPIVNS
jgi:hypothetical protein